MDLPESPVICYTCLMRPKRGKFGALGRFNFGGIAAL
jgi:hypothetical protein